jgi:hypothetical protein
MKHTLLTILAISLLSTQASAQDTRAAVLDDYTRCAMLFSVLGYSDGLNEVTLMMADKNFSEKAVEASLDAEVARMEKTQTNEWTKVAVASCKKLGFGE